MYVCWKILELYGNRTLVQADALTAGQTMRTGVFYFLILFLSYVNYCIGLKFTLILTNP